MALDFALEAAAGHPMYLQIRDGLRNDIHSGVLRSGSRLPSSRQLAADLKVSRITVANAYAELEADGYVESRGGSGTYVAPGWDRNVLPTHLEQSDAQWQQRISRPTSSWRSEIFTDSLRNQGEAGVLNFATARGDVRLFSIAELRKAIAAVFADSGADALGYESSQGYAPLRGHLAEYLSQQGVRVTPEEILITNGGQQAIDLVARALLKPGDRVMVESPTYPGALDAFDAIGATTVGIPLDAEGMQVDILSTALDREGPRLIYTVPTFHNPTATVMTATRRKELLRLAHRHNVPVLEDEYLRQVRFGSPIPPPIAALDLRGDVIHVGSFSKSLIPALRLGFVVARGPLLERLIALKRISDISCSSLLQRSLLELLENGAIHRHWKRVSHVYRHRQAAMAAALRRHFPAGTTWTMPDGGLCMWVGVPPQVSVHELFGEAHRHGVSIAGGAAFFTEPEDQPFIRLGFTAVDEHEIETGLAILGRLLHAQLQRKKLC